MLSTYADFAKSLSLIPGSGGQFEVVVNGELVFSKKAAGRYPEIAELKEAINAMRVINGMEPIENLDAFQATKMAEEWQNK